MQANYTNTGWQNFLDHPTLKDVFIKLVCSSFYEKGEAAHKFWIRSFADKTTFKDLQKLATYIETTTGLLCDARYAFTGSTISVYNYTDGRKPDFVKELLRQDLYTQLFKECWMKRTSTLTTNQKLLPYTKAAQLALVQLAILMKKLPSPH